MQPAWSRKATMMLATVGLILVMGLILAACGNGSEPSETTEGTTPTTEGTTSTTEGTTSTTEGTTSTTDAGEVAIGYISGGDSDPFVFQVTENIRAEAAAAGVKLFECDADFTAEKALECARNLSAQDLDAMINWQFIADASAAVCEAYGNLPTVTMDVPEEPCGKVFVGADNFQAGIIAGTALGEFTELEFGCEYDLYVSLELPGQPDINDARAGGTREGFEDVCGPISDDKFVQIDKQQGGADNQENIRRTFTDVLTANPNAEVVLVAAPFGDGDANASLAAADTAGRGDNIWVVAHGADESSWKPIRNDSRFLGSVAYFPERYGTLAVPAAIALAKGEDVPDKILMQHVFITADNIDEFYPENG